jgi:hypothetical protein
VDCCVPDEDVVETEAELRAKQAFMHKGWFETHLILKSPAGFYWWGFFVLSQ